MSTNPGKYGLNLADFPKDDDKKERIKLQARKMAVESMRHQKIGGEGAFGEAFRSYLSLSTPPCYTCRVMWGWQVAGQPTEADLDHSLISWTQKDHGSIPHRCAETAAYLELKAYEDNLQ